MLNQISAKLKTFTLSKAQFKRIKRWATDSGKIFAKYISDNAITSIIYNSILKTQLENEQNILTITSKKMYDTTMANKHKKDGQLINH